MAYRKIELFNRVDNYTVLKYFIFENIERTQFLLFYSHQLNYIPVMVDSFDNRWDILGNRFLSDKEVDPNIENRLSFFIEDDEIERVAKQEQIIFMNLVLTYTPEERHQQYFKNNGFDSLKELIDSYLKITQNDIVCFHQNPDINEEPDCISLSELDEKFKDQNFIPEKCTNPRKLIEMYMKKYVNKELPAQDS